MKSYKNACAVVAVCFAAFVAFAAPQIQAATPSNDAVAVYEFLEEEGYSPKFDGDGDVVFKKEGKFFIAVFDKDDENYFRLVYPNFWEIESYSEWKQALNIARATNDSVKVARIVLPNEYDGDEEINASGAVELFCEDGDAFAKMIPHSIDALTAAALKFGLQMALED